MSENNVFEKLMETEDETDINKGALLYEMTEKLKQYKKQIEHNTIEMAKLLLYIREKRLYKPQWETWDAFLAQDGIELSRAWADKLIKLYVILYKIFEDDTKINTYLSEFSISKLLIIIENCDYDLYKIRNVLINEKGLKELSVRDLRKELLIKKMSDGKTIKQVEDKYFNEFKIIVEEFFTMLEREDIIIVKNIEKLKEKIEKLIDILLNKK